MYDERPDIRLDRLADNFDYAIVGPTDGRTRVLNAALHPHSAVCQVQRDFGDGRFSGCSGFLISPRVVLTAGHCVYSAVRQRLGRRATPSRIRIIPGRNGVRAPFGKHFAARWYAPEAFVRRLDREFDYGIIILNAPLAAPRQVFRTKAATDAELQAIRSGRLLHIAGFPGDKRQGTMWEHAERLDRFTLRSLFYSVDTCPGHSGSPVWCATTRNGPYAVIGVHVAGPRPHARGPWGCRPGVPVAPAGNFNRGVRITPTTLRHIDHANRNIADKTLLRFAPA